MDLEIFHPPASLASPAIALQDFAAKQTIRFRGKSQTRLLGADSVQNVICNSSRSCFRCGFGRPMTSRVRQGNRASWLPPSKLAPARKSAQIISKQQPRDLLLPSIRPEVSSACSMTRNWLLYALNYRISHGSVSFPVRCFETCRLNSSLGSSRASMRPASSAARSRHCRPRYSAIRCWESASRSFCNVSRVRPRKSQ